MTERPTELLAPNGPEALSFPGVRLVVQRGVDRGRALRIEREEAVVGTAPSADLRLSDPTVSRNHLSLRVTPQGYLLTDLESTNGTFVDGRRIRAVFVEPGVHFDLGATRLRFEALRQRVDLKMSQASSFGRLVGVSTASRRMFALLETVARENATVLLLGETGVGKDLVAESIHEGSSRAAGPFVIFDCAAVPAGLAESELFGHEKGAFTGAVERRAGRFEEAHGGTLFLDEIGELPKELQPKLLRALEKREIRRLGGERTIATDVRIVAATNRDLRLDVNRGLFREDLFHRLNVISIRIPPLRERGEDIPLLAERFWRELTGDDEGAVPSDILQSFLNHSWPGNVRELRNRVERATVFRKPEEITGAFVADGDSFASAKTAAIDAFERSFLHKLMQRAHGNTSEAARLAKVDRVHLTKLLQKHGLYTRKHR